MATTSEKLQTLASVISSGSVTVFPYERKDNNKSCAVYSLISTVPFFDMSKNLLLTKNRVQVTCYGTTLSLSRTMADTVTSLLQINNTDFELSFLVNDRTLKDLETGLYKSYIDLFIW